MHRKHLRTLDRIDEVMLGVIGKAAAKERRSHAYNNRTGDLEQSTEAILISSSPSLTQVDLVMGMHYAEYIHKRGLTNIDQVRQEAEDQLTRLLT